MKNLLREISLLVTALGVARILVSMFCALVNFQDERNLFIENKNIE